MACRAILMGIIANSIMKGDHRRSRSARADSAGRPAPRSIAMAAAGAAALLLL
jgi:hypothetical protein